MSENKCKQKNLTPIILEEDMPGYKTYENIKEILKDPDVYNIAITGPYGSGKSSVLKTLKEKCPNYNYLTISLALLNGKSNDEDKEETIEKFSPEEQQKVEFSILQQLIYKEKPETLPDSRFRRIRQRVPCNKYCLLFGGVVTLFIVALFIVFEPKWANVDTLCIFFNLGHNWKLASSLYMLGCISYVAAYLYRQLSLYHIKALSIKDLSIELGENSSVFNKHLDEIVYFFESTEYNVVIIEDLDRFRCPEIFLKLREINFLLQQSEVIKRKVKFIYAVKDDLFKNEERTKFFDYIATIIPVVNSKNSYEKLTQELTERGYDLDKDILRDLSEFVDGMRMLRNVANEFQQYMEQMSEPSYLKKEYLLAMIIYKNRHPDDFCKLHYKDGKVYKFISNKNEWVKIADEVLKPKLEFLPKRREEENNLKNSKLKDLRRRYMAKYQERIPNLASISCNNTYHTINEFIESSELFEELIKQRTISYKHNYLPAGSIDINFADIEKEVDDKVSYTIHKEHFDTNLNEIDKKIKKVKDEKNRLRNLKLAELLIKYPEIKKCKLYQDIKLSDLMVHFLQRGYIDETYYDYITLYDGTIMSLTDRNLLLRIKQNDADVSYDEKIDDIKTFVNELPTFVYEYKSVLNYQIADYLEENSANYESVLKDFEQHFVESSTPQLDFLAKYYKRKSKGAEILWKKYIQRHDSWECIKNYERQEYFATLTEAWLYYYDNSSIPTNCRNWLNDNLGFCVERLEVIGVEHLKKIIKECKFEDISAISPIEGKYQNDAVMNIANYILDKGLFELTENNLFIAKKLTGRILKLTYNNRFMATNLPWEKKFEYIANNPLKSIQLTKQAIKEQTALLEKWNVLQQTEQTIKKQFKFPYNTPFVTNDLDVDRTKPLTISDFLSSNNENEGLVDYIKKNFKYVFENIISKSKGQETEMGLLYILNHEELDKNKKTEYLKSQTDNKVRDIKEIEKDSGKRLALLSGVLVPNWKNVLNYYEFDNNSISADLENFINNNVDLLVKDEYPTDSESSLAGKIVYGHHLNITAFEKLLSVLKPHVGKDDKRILSEDIESERLKLLISNNYLSDNVETANVVAQHEASLYAKYLSYHIDSYIANYANYDTNSKTLTALLNKESSLSDEQRWNLAKNISSDLIEQDAELANAILELMLNRKEELDWDIVVAVIKNATIQPQKQQFQKMLIKNHRKYVDEITIILNSMGHPYSEIAGNSRPLDIPDDFKEYLEIIKPLKLFNKYRKLKNVYRITS